MMKLKKGFAVAMAAGVLAGSSFGAQAFAVAQDEGGEAAGPEQAAQAQTVFTHTALPKASDTYTLKIHKFDNTGTSTDDAFGKAGTGAAIADTSKFGTPLDQTHFKIEKVKGVDLLTNAGWIKAEGLTKNAATTKATIEDLVANKATKLEAVAGADNLVTNASGEITKGDLAAGLYLVTETTPKPGYSISSGPFLVALPLTDPDNHSAWLKTVNVYPKNVKNSEQPYKTVKDSTNLVAGKTGETDYITYDIQQTLVKGPDYTKYVVSDIYPQARLTADKTEVTGNIGGTSGTPLVLGTDFTVADPDITTSTDKGVISATFTADGLAKINTAQAGTGDKTVHIFFKFHVKENADAETGAIVNEFQVFERRTGVTPPPNTPDKPGNPDQPTPPPGEHPNPKSYYGNLKINKVDTEGNQIATTDDNTKAVFDLYECTKTAGKEEYTIASGATALKTGIKDEKDAVEIKGLLANDYRDQQYTADPTSAYCLVETKAPAGFQLAAEPFGFQIKVGQDPDAATTTPTIAVKSDFNVVDSKPKFDLPLTGGKGVFALLLAGAAFLVLGRGYSVYAGRRNKA